MAAATMAAATTVAALGPGAVFTGAIVAGIADVTLAVSGLVRMEVIEGLFPTFWNGATVTATRIIAIVNVTVEALRSAKPWAGSDEKSATEPIRSIVAIRRTTVGGVVEVAVGAVRRQTDSDANLSLCFGSRSR